MQIWKPRENAHQSLAVDMISIFTKTAAKRTLIKSKSRKRNLETESDKRKKTTAREFTVLVSQENKSAILKFSREKPAVNFIRH